jgi:ferritin-like metal-binding protein YciE
MEFKDLLQTEIRKMYDMEKELTDGLADMAEKAQNPQLKQAFMDHRQQTMEHVRRLEQVAQMGGFDIDGEKADVIHTLRKATKGVIGDYEEGPLLDAALIASGQKAEHIEMAMYGTARSLCKTLGMTDALPLLEQSLQEEKDADMLLTQLAESGINQQAMQISGQAYAG